MSRRISLSYTIVGVLCALASALLVAPHEPWPIGTAVGLACLVGIVQMIRSLRRGLEIRPWHTWASVSIGLGVFFVALLFFRYHH